MKCVEIIIFFSWELFSLLFRKFWEEGGRGNCIYIKVVIFVLYLGKDKISNLVSYVLDDGFFVSNLIYY